VSVTIHRSARPTCQAVGTLDVHRVARAGHWSAYENAAEVNRLMLEFFAS
jgi:pimeloyl-ACP methyl ester carboxylesterase